MDLENLDCPKFNPTKTLKTYIKSTKSVKRPEELTTINAVNFLLAGTLKYKVCRYCLNVTDELLGLDHVMEIGNKGGLYSVAVRDMIASFHPFKVADDPNFPDKICNKCLDRTINAYLFTQQCEQAERALKNCIEEINAKSLKLDPLDIQKLHRRGRRKTYVNHDTLNVSYSKVIDYADPIIHIINTSSEPLSFEPAINPLECLKCCQVLPNLQSLANHSKTHPESMWFTCRLCALSFPRLYLLKRHYRNHQKDPKKIVSKEFECKHCSETHKNYNEHLQHIEKHNFKIVLEHVLYDEMNDLCAVCLGEDSLMPLDDIVSLHGGPPELMGERTIKVILDHIMPLLDETIFEYTGSKICEECLNTAITCYTFLHNNNFARKRLSTCISHMLENLKNITPEKTLCVEIAKEMIMPIKLDTTSFSDEDIDEGTDEDIKKEVFLEDEYRIKSEDEIDQEIEPLNGVVTNSKTELIDKVHVNGYQLDVCREFLTFNKKPKIEKVEKKYTCPMCDKYFVSDYFVKKHILKHISMNVRCMPCGTEFGNKFSLNEHTKYAHILFQSDYRACKTCGRGFAKLDQLKNHEKVHKNKKCLLCNKVFKTQRYHDIHMKRHVPKLMALKKIYAKSCSFCEMECSNENQLQVHVNKVHLQIKPFNCDMCDKKFYTEYNLRFHKKIHSQFSKEKCNFCGLVFKSRKLLVIHIRKHIGATPHQCQLCNQAFYSQAKLKHHLNSHHGGSFICKICKHVSVSKNELKTHVAKAHTFL